MNRVSRRLVALTFAASAIASATTGKSAHAVAWDVKFNNGTLTLSQCINSSVSGSINFVRLANASTISGTTYGRCYVNRDANMVYDVNLNTVTPASEDDRYLDLASVGDESSPYNTYAVRNRMPTSNDYVLFSNTACLGTATSVNAGTTVYVGAMRSVRRANSSPTGCS